MSLRCTVVSFVPCHIRQEKPGLVPPRYHIPPSDGKIPQILHVDTAVHFVYLDASRGHLQVKNPSDVIAKSIVHDYTHSQMGIDDESCPAIFWVPEELSAGQVLQKYGERCEEVKSLQRRWIMNLCKIADDDWRKYHQHNVISDFQRRLAEFIGLNPKEHEWMSPLAMLENKDKTEKDCPFCFTRIPIQAPVCANCHRTIDIKKVAELEKVGV